MSRSLTLKIITERFQQGKKKSWFLSRGSSSNSTKPKSNSNSFTETLKINNLTLPIVSWPCSILYLSNVLMIYAKTLSLQVACGESKACKIISKNKSQPYYLSSKNYRLLKSDPNWDLSLGDSTQVKWLGLDVRSELQSKTSTIYAWREANFNKRANSSKKLWRVTSFQDDSQIRAYVVCKVNLIKMKIQER